MFYLPSPPLNFFPLARRTPKAAVSSRSYICILSFAACSRVLDVICMIVSPGSCPGWKGTVVCRHLQINFLPLFWASMQTHRKVKWLLCAVISKRENVTLSMHRSFPLQHFLWCTHNFLGPFVHMAACVMSARSWRKRSIGAWKHYCLLNFWRIVYWQGEPFKFYITLYTVLIWGINSNWLIVFPGSLVTVSRQTIGDPEVTCN